MPASIANTKDASAPSSLLSAAMGLTSLRSPGATAVNASGDEAASIGSADGDDSTVVRDLFKARAQPPYGGASAIGIPTGAAPADMNYEPIPFRADAAATQPWPSTRMWPSSPVIMATPSLGTSFPLASTEATGISAGGLQLALPNPPRAAIHPAPIHPGARAMVGYGAEQIGTAATAAPLLQPGQHSLPAPATAAVVTPPGMLPPGLALAGMLPPGIALAAPHPELPYMQVGPVTGMFQPMDTPLSLPAPHKSAAHKPPPHVENGKKFPEILYDVVSNQQLAGIISWLHHGRGFIIHDKEAFVTKVLHEYFHRGGFTSFLRRLTRWQFVRVVSGQEKGAYYGKHFLRGHPHLLSYITYRSDSKYAEMKRLAKKAKEREGGNVGVQNPDTNEAPEVIEDSGPVEPEKYKSQAEGNVKIDDEWMVVSPWHSDAETELTNPARSNQPVTVHKGNKARMEAVGDLLPAHPSSAAVWANPQPAIAWNPPQAADARVDHHPAVMCAPPYMLADSYVQQAATGTSPQMFTTSHPVQESGLIRPAQATDTHLLPSETPPLGQQILFPQSSGFGDDSSIGGFSGLTRNTFTSEPTGLAANPAPLPENSDRKRILEVEHDKLTVLERQPCCQEAAAAANPRPNAGAHYPPNLPGGAVDIAVLPHGLQEMSTMMQMGHDAGPDEDDGGLCEVTMNPRQERGFAEYLLRKRRTEEAHHLQS